MKINSQFKNALSLVIVLFSVGLIGYLNFQQVRFLFYGEMTQFLGSIEISYIQMAKFWAEGGSGGWQPLWYLGYPWHVFYTPLLPALEVFLHRTLDFSFAHAYRVITASAYILVPVSTYLFVWQISKSKAGALIAALFYSFVPSIIGFLIPEVGQDVLSGGSEPRRFTILVRWGEGPHTQALVFVPLFGLFLSRYLEKRRFIELVLACVCLGLVGLTNAIALWACLLLMLAIFLSETIKKATNIIGLVKDFLAVGSLSFGLVSFWYNLPFIKTFFRESGGVLNNWLALVPWGIIPLAAVFVLVYFLIRKSTKNFAGVATGLFWFLMLFVLVYVYYVSGEEKLEYVPQVLRLNTEVDLAISVIIGAIFSNLFVFLTARGGKFKIPSILAAFVIISLPVFGLLVWQKNLAGRLSGFTKPLGAGGTPKIEETAEYRAANKLAELTRDTGQRVFAPGNYGFWLDYFVPVPQLRGALYQSSTHFWPENIYFQVTNGQDGNISLAWLKIANIGKVVYTTAQSAEPFKDYKVPQEKFVSKLREISEDRGDIYYDVPLKNDSLAKVVEIEGAGNLKKPFNAVDEEPIYAYVSWFEQKSEKKLEVSKISNSRIRISGELAGGEGVLYQGTYDAGWKVKNSGWRVIRDPFDFMVLVPKEGGKSVLTAGRFDIELVYTKPWSVYLGYLITLLTAMFIVRRLIKEYKGKQGLDLP